MRGGCFSTLIVALLSGCSGADAVGPPGDASLPCGQRPAIVEDGGSCTPQLPACWAPAWKPPKAPSLHACSAAQIMEELTKCWGDTYDPAGCDVFERDPANGTCLGCLFSTPDEPRQGAIVFLANGRVLPNTAGCLSLLDGDTSASSCGAKLQAYQECRDAACAACSTSDGWEQCWDDSNTGTCALLLDDAVCWRRPSYAVCRSYNTFEETFVAMAGVFCNDGLIAGDR